MKKWAVFISGRGSNLKTLLDDASVKIVGVVSSKKEAYGLIRCSLNEIPVHLLDKEIDWQKCHEQLLAWGATHIWLLGFMRLIPSEFIEKWQGRILNVHPSLLPAYPGIKSIEKSFADKAAMGVTVHEVIPEMDAGPVVLQEIVLPASHSLTLEEAEFLIHKTERKLVRKASREWNQKTQMPS
ncbi:MAG: formyltransferase family protein [Pseudobdellovibrionaceae bacterium]